MNKFLYSLSCNWMTIIDCLFYAFDSLSLDISLEYVAKLAVAMLYAITQAKQDTKNDLPFFNGLSTLEELCESKCSQ